MGDAVDQPDEFTNIGFCMGVVYLNGQFIPEKEALISPDDRAFLFGDSIYEVTRWYGGYFFDIASHAARLRRSLREIRINWTDSDMFEEISKELIHRNDLGAECAVVYFQVTRGVAPRNHPFPDPPVKPTVYGFARRHSINTLLGERGASLYLTDDTRWSRCDIKTTALIGNILALQEAHDNDCEEVCFVRNGLVTEGAHSNIFFVRDGTIYTHPESTHILSGITRKNIIALANENDMPLIEEAVPGDMLAYVHEAFFTGTAGEIVPAIRISGQVIGDGKPGPVTRKLQRLLRDHIQAQNPIR